ncbi:MAG: hypothetical protein U0237_13920 [Thermoleophilia bacterium]
MAGPTPPVLLAASGAERATSPLEPTFEHRASGTDPKKPESCDEHNSHNNLVLGSVRHKREREGQRNAPEDHLALGLDALFDQLPVGALETLGRQKALQSTNEPSLPEDAAHGECADDENHPEGKALADCRCDLVHIAIGSRFCREGN